MLEPGKGDFLDAATEREIRLYFSYAEANVVRTKVAGMLRDRATVSRLRTIEGGWAFTINRGGERVAITKTAPQQEPAESA